MKKLLLAIMLAAAGGQTFAALKVERIDYKQGGVALQGYLAYDPALTGKRPGVMIVHEWKGLNEYAQQRAEQLAGLGYVAFAVDMYGKGVLAKDHEEAGKLSGVFFNDRKRMRERALAGLAILKKQKNVDTARLAAIGYCFGGTTVLELARAGVDLKGVASFHGNLKTPVPAKPNTVKAKVLVLHGADDAWTAEGVAPFQAEMKAANADWQLNAYGGAVHGFTVPTAGDDPSKGMAYHADADRRSWRALMDFFGEVLK